LHPQNRTLTPFPQSPGYANFSTRLYHPPPPVFASGALEGLLLHVCAAFSKVPCDCPFAAYPFYATLTSSISLHATPYFASAHPLLVPLVPSSFSPPPPIKDCSPRAFSGVLKLFRSRLNLALPFFDLSTVLTICPPTPPVVVFCARFSVFPSPFFYFPLTHPLLTLYAFILFSSIHKRIPRLICTPPNNPLARPFRTTGPPVPLHVMSAMTQNRNDPHPPTPIFQMRFSDELLPTLPRFTLTFLFFNDRVTFNSSQLRL